MKNMFSKKQTEINFAAGICDTTPYSVIVTKNFFGDRTFNFYRNNILIEGFEKHVIEECFRYGVYRKIEN